MSSLERLQGTAAPSEAAPSTPLAGRRYHEDRLHLLVRDPRRVFACWEVSGSTAERAAALARDAGAPLRYALAVDRAARPGEAPGVVADVDLPDAIGGEGWYAALPPDPERRGYGRARLGIRLPAGFETLLVSRWVPIPPEAPCREIGAWPVDRERLAWLRGEAERQRRAAGGTLATSAARYLAGAPEPAPPRR